MGKLALRILEAILALGVFGIGIGIVQSAWHAIEIGRWHPRMNILWFGVALIFYAGIRLFFHALTAILKELRDLGFIESV